MSWFRKNPLFASVITLCALLVLGEMALTYERFTASRAAEKKLRERMTELDGMANISPPPKREVAAAIAADLEKANAALASMQKELKGHGPVAERLRNEKIPAARPEAYFDLATFVEKTRELAKKNEVEVRAEAARLGFNVYVNEGPEADRIEPVFRQRQIAQYLMEALIEARPRAILSVKRERTVTKAEREARDAAIAAGQPAPEISDSGDESGDYFAIDPRDTARVPGYVDATAFRIGFVGQTTALRAFLNRLASFELPVLVRQVEVDVASAEEATSQAPAEEAPAPDQPQAAAAAAAPSILLTADAPAPAPKAAPPKPRVPSAAPIVTKPLSKFTVTVEYVELVTPPPANAADGSAPPQPPS